MVNHDNCTKEENKNMHNKNYKFKIKNKENKNKENMAKETNKDFEADVELDRQLSELKMFEEMQLNDTNDHESTNTIQLDWSDFFVPDLGGDDVDNNDKELVFPRPTLKRL